MHAASQRPSDMGVVDGIAPSRSSIVLFGTETGTSQDLAYELSRTLERHRFTVEVDDFDNVAPSSLGQYDLVVFVLATTGQGEFPSNTRKFWTSLLRKKLSSTFLANVTYALFGLGDTSYPKFNFAARKLDKRVKQLGAVSLLEPGEADEQGEDSTDGAFIAWSQLFKSKILEYFPLSSHEHPIPDSEALPSKWTLSHGVGNGVSNGHLSHTIDHANPSLKPFEIPFEVVLEQNDRLTPTDHWQDVRFLKLKADRSVRYLPGDALAIRPKNMIDDVQHLIQLMNWQDIADQTLRFHLNKTSIQTRRLPDPTLSTSQAVTLRRLLTNNLDIRAIPRRSFFACISNYTENEMQKERLQEFTDPQYIDEYYDYATRPRRSIIEILQEFDSVQIPWQEAINVFPILRPRQFSIASGGTLTQDGSVFELLVAIVRYRTVIKSIREGVCTRYLAQLPVGSKLDVVLKTEGRFHQPDHLASTNHLMIGAGTGIAPLRATIHEKSSTGSASTTLIFGCRSAKADYFFEDEWRRLADGDYSGVLQVLTAFSRDQKHKVYVQDRIREQALLVRRFLFDPKSTVIVCGSSGAMPKAIRQAFVDVLCSDAEAEIAKMSHDDAEQFLAKMEKQGRYKQETW